MGRQRCSHVINETEQTEQTEQKRDKIIKTGVFVNFTNEKRMGQSNGNMTQSTAPVPEGHLEFFRYKNYIFDVEKAYRLARELGKEPQVVDRSFLEAYCQTSFASLRHDWRHVPVDRPVLFISHPETGHPNVLLIDGNHRLRKCFEYNLPLRAIFFTVEESLLTLADWEAVNFVLGRELAATYTTNRRSYF